MTGRPFGTSKYSPEELWEKAQKFFEFCDDPKNGINRGMNGITLKPKTLSGLCLCLGVAKDYLCEKAKDPAYSESLKLIKLEVENSIEEGILTNTYHGTSGIFNLKNNFGWVDKSEVDNHHDGEIKIIKPKTYD